MILQNNLKWDSHIKMLIRKINSRIPLFFQLREILPPEKRIIIFNSLILSNIIYGIELFAKNNCGWNRLLQKAQNRLLKILFKLPRLTSTNALHKSQNVLKIQDQSKLRTALIGQRVIHYPTELNIAYTEIQNNVDRNRNLRDNLTLRISATSYLAKNKITENAAIIWNDLPHDIRTIRNRDLFKEKVKNRYLNSYD